MTTPSYCIDSAGEAVKSSAEALLYSRVVSECSVNSWLQLLAVPVFPNEPMNWNLVRDLSNHR
jgi:hypothetical protein